MSLSTLALLVVSVAISMVSGVFLIKNLDNMDRTSLWSWGAVFLLASVNALWCSWRLL